MPAELSIKKITYKYITQPLGLGFYAECDEFLDILFVAKDSKHFEMMSKNRKGLQTVKSEITEF